MRGNKTHTALAGVYHIAGKAGCVADPTGGVESGQANVTNGGGVEPAVKDVDIVDIADLLDITNAAPHYGAAALSLLANHGCQISAHKSAVLGLVKQIGHEDIVPRPNYQPPTGCTCLSYPGTSPAASWRFPNLLG